MRSVPTTSLDLTSADVVADPYPHFAAERARHPVAWHEASGMYLTFTHAAVSAVQRDRRLGRLWRDKEPLDHLEPFNLLHRNQMMENEPPEHTRLRRPVASGVRPRARRAAAAAGARARRLAARRRSMPRASTSSRSTPSRCRCWSSPSCSGVPSSYAPRPAATGRRRSCGCTRSRRPPQVVDAAVRRRDRVRRPGARARRPSVGPTPADDLITDLVAHRAHRGRGGRRRACSCSTPATRPRSTCSATAWSRCSGAGCVPAPDVAGDRRGDAALRLRAPAVRAHRHPGRRGRPGSPSRRAEDRGAARRGQPRPGGIRRPGRVRRRPRPQPAPGLRGRRALLPRRAAGADGARRVR